MITVSGTLEAETDKAILLKIEDEHLEPITVWLPKSQIEYDEDEAQQGENLDISCPEWLMEAKRGDV